jgi:hypothetical protein
VLADRLSGGVTVAGSGKGGVYVRSGWQAKTIENAINRARGKHGDNSKIVLDPHVETDPMVQTVGKMLGDVHEEIQMLWSHPIVRGLIKRRKLKLDEWAELFVPFFCGGEKVLLIMTTASSVTLSELSRLVTSRPSVCFSLSKILYRLELFC